MHDILNCCVINVQNYHCIEISVSFVEKKLYDNFNFLKQKYTISMQILYILFVSNISRKRDESLRMLFTQLSIKNL